MALKSPEVTEKRGRNTPVSQRTSLHPANRLPYSIPALS